MCYLLLRLPDDVLPFSFRLPYDDLLLVVSLEDCVECILFFLKQRSICVGHLAHLRGKLVAVSSLLLLIECHSLHDLDLHSLHFMLEVLFTFHFIFAKGIDEGSGLLCLGLDPLWEFEEKVCVDSTLVFQSGTYLFLFLQVYLEEHHGVCQLLLEPLSQ